MGQQCLSKKLGKELLLPQFCMKLMKSRTRNFLHGEFILAYQLVTEQQKTPFSKDRYITGSLKGIKKPYFKGFLHLFDFDFSPKLLKFKLYCTQ